MSPAQPARTAPRKLAGRRGGGVPAGEVGAVVPAPRGPSRGCSGVFSWLVASSAFGKLQSQQPAGRGGRVQPGGKNFDVRAFCKEAAPPDGVRGGRGAGVGAAGAGRKVRLTRSQAQLGWERGETYLGTCSNNRGSAGGRGPARSRGCGEPAPGGDSGRLRLSQPGSEWGGSLCWAGGAGAHVGGDLGLEGGAARGSLARDPDLHPAGGWEHSQLKGLGLAQGPGASSLPRGVPLEVAGCSFSIRVGNFLKSGCGSFLSG